MARSGLRGASAEALAALTPRVEATSGEEAAQLGADLFGIAAVLRAEPSLRRVATDVSTDAAAKSGLVRQLFEGKVSQPALDLLADAVERRWTATRDLADALEDLGVVAVVRSAGDDADRLSDELFAVAQLIEEQPDLRAALSDPARSAEDRSALLRQLIQDRTLPATQRLAEPAIVGGHRTVSVALEEYQKVAAAAHDRRVATVWVASELSDADRERLQAALSRQYGRQVHLNVIVEPELLGGMRVEIGDDVIDCTVRGRLEDARRRLAG